MEQDYTETQLMVRCVDVGNNCLEKGKLFIPALFKACVGVRYSRLYQTAASAYIRFDHDVT